MTSCAHVCHQVDFTATHATKPPVRSANASEVEAGEAARQRQVESEARLAAAAAAELAKEPEPVTEPAAQAEPPAEVEPVAEAAVEPEAELESQVGLLDAIITRVKRAFSHLGFNIIDFAP